MATSPNNTKDQAVEIRDAWLNMGNTETFGGITYTEFTAALSALETTETTISSLQDQLTNARNTRDANRLALWNLVKRARSGAKAQKGDDSDQYERFGGTRLSERK
jgi:hypothetical protein